MVSDMSDARFDSVRARLSNILESDPKSHPDFDTVKVALAEKGLSDVEISALKESTLEFLI